MCSELRGGRGGGGEGGEGGEGGGGGGGVGEGGEEVKDSSYLSIDLYLSGLLESELLTRR